MVVVLVSVWHTVGSWDNRIHSLHLLWPLGGVVGCVGVGLLLPAMLKHTLVVCGGVVRVVVCQLHSGREHLIWTAAAVHVISCGGLCGVVVVCRECSHLLIGTSLWGV